MMLNQIPKKLGLLTLLVSALFLSETSLAVEHPGKALAEKIGVPWPAVIGHRGASFDAPEETIPSYALARDLGADYLEMDIQRTKDGVLIALHDNTLGRTTNIAQVYPERVNDPISTFTLEELKRLDAGSWFNAAFPARARSSYVGLKILTLNEVINIAEEGENKPGLYVETKLPAQFPGVEEDLQKLLAKRGWLDQRPAAAKGHVNVANTPGRVILQTFERPSLELLQKNMPQVPKVLLLWIGDGYMEASSTVDFKASGAKDKAAFYAKREVKSEAEFAAWMDWAKAHGASGIGPASVLKHGGDQSYMDMVKPWMTKMAHDRGLLIHPYTVDAAEDFKALSMRGADGFFTNRAAQLLKFYGRPSKDSIDTLLRRNGY
ncbi:glycerophosphodiester phosphodiesterase [Pseudomonas sp. 10B1]|uniref:glycerophosphodiester phosphodiesterase n=1 Tax=unclassified Pseudomonas TaxID=196821 RepID=UPI002B23D82D|nr:MULTISPECIES: glycerophosphodiester phosphodiesterase [unclassified Pseudomonas]MEA9977553.1 glycerophosphodiester phosphodiesterase [Pseudomonas sp. RTS4]MEA9996392.1 glycerophosphodiester phosphodiesterase [Pseudomonas sp. AA4]MEB0088105.1 glycerophosphodiester phosphodiesterase [Pseudomonas sp. RTI1]MEB0126932.1 glycerophosphodiester phosphodiesterase [Pseudomonas sp. CCC1.2]MEB0153874.1 glycerophosphodiester phosphodiesterase [Pseudomonas sp. CCC4.3]